MANVFYNNITNSVIAPLSTQLQNDISQKLNHHTVHFNQLLECAYQYLSVYNLIQQLRIHIYNYKKSKTQ